MRELSSIRGFKIKLIILSKALLMTLIQTATKLKVILLILFELDEKLISPAAMLAAIINVIISNSKLLRLC